VGGGLVFAESRRANKNEKGDRYREENGKRRKEKMVKNALELLMQIVSW